MDAPREKQALAQRVKAELPKDVLAGLNRLRDTARDQPAFAAAAAAWVRAASGFVPREQARGAAGQTLTLPLRYVDKYQRRGRYETPTGTTARRARKETGQEAGSDDAAPPAGAVVEPTGGAAGYRVFTTAHDRVVNAAALGAGVLLDRLARFESGGDRELGPGELIIVPRGTEHCPVALTDEVHVVLLEPAGTLNCTRKVPVPNALPLRGTAGSAIVSVPLATTRPSRTSRATKTTSATSVGAERSGLRPPQPC